jgi:hypothetical protein
MAPELERRCKCHKVFQRMSKIKPGKKLGVKALKAVGG